MSEAPGRAVLVIIGSLPLTRYQASALGCRCIFLWNGKSRLVSTRHFVVEHPKVRRTRVNRVQSERSPTVLAVRLSGGYGHARRQGNTDTLRRRAGKQSRCNESPEARFARVNLEIPTQPRFQCDRDRAVARAVPQVSAQGVLPRFDLIASEFSHAQAGENLSINV